MNILKKIKFLRRLKLFLSPTSIVGSHVVIMKWVQLYMYSFYNKNFYNKIIECFICVQVLLLFYNNTRLFSINITNNQKRYPNISINLNFNYVRIEMKSENTTQPIKFLFLLFRKSFF